MKKNNIINSENLKKFAIGFYGHIRTWEKTKESFITNILDSVNPVIPDIFIHTYDISNVSSDKYYTNSEIQDMLTFKLPNNTEIIPKILEIDNSTEYCSNIQKELETIYHPDPNTFNTLCTMKKIYLCHENIKKYELENNIKYDIIMFTRFDMIYNQPLNLDNINNDNTIYLHYTGAPDPCDEIAIGFPRCIDIYVSRYKQLIENKVRTEHTFMGVCPTGDSHLLLKYCCIKFGIGNWGWTNIGTASKCF